MEESSARVRRVHDNVGGRKRVQVGCVLKEIVILVV